MARKDKLPRQDHHPSHKHGDGCYRLVMKCGKREHKAHTANCQYDPKRKKGHCAGLHTHSARCYKKKLECKMYGTPQK